LVHAGNVVRDEARRTEAVVQDFHLNLAAVRVARQRELDAELRRAIKRIGVVRQENIGHVAPDERSDLRESLYAAATGRAFALVVDANQVKERPAKPELGVLAAQQLHSRLLEQDLRRVFRASVDFVIAVTAPYAEWRVQSPDFVYTIGERIAGTGDEIAGHDGKIRPEVVGH